MVHWQGMYMPHVYQAGLTLKDVFFSVVVLSVMARPAHAPTLVVLLPLLH